MNTPSGPGRIDISSRAIARISGPVVLNQVTFTAMGIIDTVMVGTFGVAALAGVGIGAFTIWWLLSLLFGALGGVNAGVAQGVGAGDRRSVGLVFWHGTYLGLVLGVVLVCLWPLVPVFVSWVGPTPEVRAVAGGYLAIRLLSVLLLVPLGVADSFFRGLGRTDIPLYGSVAQLVLNCGLNYVLMYGKFGLPALGPVGVAWGTVIAQSVVGGLMFAGAVCSPLGRQFLLRSTWRFERATARTLTAMSLPIGLQSLVEMTGISALVAFISRLGEVPMAATNAVIQNWSVAFMAGHGLSVTATTLVGQCVGGGSPDDARLAVRRILRAGYVLFGFAAVVYLLFPESLMAIFADGEDLERLRPLARPLFLVVVVCMWLDLRFMVYWGSLRGAGDTEYPMWVNIASSLLLFVPAVALVTPRYGTVAAWWCMVAHYAVMQAALAVRMRGANWLGRGLRERLAAEAPGAGVAFAPKSR